MAKLSHSQPESLQNVVWEPRQQNIAIGLRSVRGSGAAVRDSQRFVAIARFRSASGVRSPEALLRSLSAVRRYRDGTQRSAVA
eukprot:2111708-Alexandrium_andersonii.AAC.1